MSDPDHGPSGGETRASLLRAAAVLLVVVAVGAIAFYVASTILR